MSAKTNALGVARRMQSSKENNDGDHMTHVTGKAKYIQAHLVAGCCFVVLCNITRLQTDSRGVMMGGEVVLTSSWESGLGSKEVL